MSKPEQHYRISATRLQWDVVRDVCDKLHEHLYWRFRFVPSKPFGCLRDEWACLAFCASALGIWCHEEDVLRGFPVDDDLQEIWNRTPKPEPNCNWDELAPIELPVRLVPSLSWACELYARIGVWQLDVVLDTLPLDGSAGQYTALDSIKNLAAALKTKFTGLPPYSSHGIAGKNVDEKYRIAYDIHQVLRHRLARDELEEEGKDRPDVPLTCYDPPLQTAKCPLIQVQKVSTVAAE